MGESNLALNTLSISQAMTAFFTMLPPLAVVREAAPDDPEVCRNVRSAEVAGATISIGIGTILAYLDQSSAPLLVSVAVAVLVVVVYETLLRRAP